MRTTQQLSTTLPHDTPSVSKAKAQTGKCASDSEAIGAGLRAPMAVDRAIDGWLRDQVGPAYDALKANPSRAVTPEQVRARLAAERVKA